MVIALVDFSEIPICRRQRSQRDSNLRPQGASLRLRKLAGRWAANRERKRIENIRVGLRGLEGALSLKMSKHSRSRQHQCGRFINKHYWPRAHSLKTWIYESRDGTHRDKLSIFHACSSMFAAFVNTSEDHARAMLHCIWIVYREKRHLQSIQLQEISRRI